MSLGWAISVQEALMECRRCSAWNQTANRPTQLVSFPSHSLPHRFEQNYNFNYVDVWIPEPQDSTCIHNPIAGKPRPPHSPRSHNTRKGSRCIVCITHRSYRPPAGDSLLPLLSK